MQTQLKKAGESMDRRLEHMRTEFSEIRAGRANPAVLDKVKVDYYGAPTPVNQLAAVSVTEARTLTIQPWDASVLRQIEKAIQTSDIGINPQNDGKIIRLIFPPLTEDRRKEIVKDVQKIAEEILSIKSQGSNRSFLNFSSPSEHSVKYKTKGQQF